MMTYDEAVSALQSMTMFVPGWDICQSCGHEHNCQTEGCAILREAIATMEQLYKDCSISCYCCTNLNTPSIQEPCASCNIWDDGWPHAWQWRGVQKEARSNGKAD